MGMSESRQPCIFIGSPGGAGAVADHFLALGAELARRGNEVKMISSHAEANGCCGNHNPECLAWPSRRPTRWTDALFLAGLIRRFKPDCLIANFAAVNWMCLVGWLLGVRNRIAFYHTLSSQIARDSRSTKNRLSVLRIRKRWVYRATTCIVANSQAASEDVQQSYSVPSSKCTVWRNSISDPLDKVDVKSADERADLIVCAGRLDCSKGQDVLLEALAMCGSKIGSTKVEFLGSGPMLESLRQMAEQYRVGDRCSFAGTVTRERVLSRMAQARVTVVPSRNEAFGLVNIESMAVGTPVIASRVDGIPEVIRDGMDGFLVPSGDPQALAEKLLSVLPNIELRERLGRNARQRYLEQFEDRLVIRKQADWLDELIQPNVGSAQE